MGGGGTASKLFFKTVCTKGSLEHRLRDKNILLQENPNHNTRAKATVQHTSHMN